MIAEYWFEELPVSHREALHSSLCILTDDFLGESDHIDSLIAYFLPSKYSLLYTELFLKRFFATLLTVGYKLAQSDPPVPLLSCTAEELALHILIEEASELLEQDGVKPQFGMFEEEAFQDADFEYLYDMRLDGVEDSEIGAEMGIGLLHFDEWFEPFLNASTTVHPYSWEDKES